MTRYQNGRVPRSALVKRGVHYLPAGTWAKWDHLVADVKKRFGVTLHITSSKGNPGSGAYRDLAMQRDMKAKHGSGAAAPGYSSHGGTFLGKDAMAIDISNYWAISESNLFTAARRAGFVANYYNGQGKPDEPWHIIDYDPYRKVAEPTEEVDMPIRAKSKQTGDWYVIFEHTVTRIPAGKPGSENHLHALGYTNAAEKGFPVVESARIQRMLSDAKARATAFLTRLGAASYVKEMQAELDELISHESGADIGLTVEDVKEAVADVISQGIVDGLTQEQIAEAVQDGLDGLTITVSKEEA